MDSKDLISRIEGELGSAEDRDLPSSLHPPPRVPDHELLRRIGAGSYGEVWLARAVTGQWRAVKSVSRDRFASDRPYDREFRGVVQFEPISRSHSALVHVLHVGRDDEAGAFYYVMELADPALESATDLAKADTSLGVPDPAVTTRVVASSGAFSSQSFVPRTLRTDLRRRGRLRVAEAIRLGVDLAGGLGHIHRHGLVHRDVKPSNVIYVHGQPKLADLGLVTHSSEARSFVGTEGFIPPEGPGTVKADLFALGRLLYEAVTGKDRCEFPELPSDLDSWPDREEFLEFNEVLTVLCAPEPERRYSNAAEVAGDLNLILAGRSVRRANAIEFRMRQAWRITTMTLVGLAIAATVVWTQQSRQEQTEMRAAHEKELRQRAERAERESQSQLYTALLEQARATVRGGELGQRFKALDAVQRAAAITNTAELRREALTAISLPDARWRKDLAFEVELTGTELDPSFERIAICHGRGAVEVRGTSDLSLIATLPASTNLMCYVIIWSPDGRFLAVKRDYNGAGTGSDLEVWDLQGQAKRTLLVRNASYNAWSFHPHRPELIIAVDRRFVVNFNVETGQEVARLPVEVTPDQLKYSPDGRLVAAAYRLDDAWGVSVHPAGKLDSLCSHLFNAGLGAIQWHPQGRWVAVPDLSGSVHLMSPETGETRRLGRHRAEAVEAQFDPRGDYLISGGWERALICWDLRTMRRAFNIEVDSYIPRFSASGSKLAVLRGRDVQLYDFERPEAVREMPLPSASRLRFASFSPDGRRLAASLDESLAVWDLEAVGPAAVTDANRGALSWAADGSELFVSGDTLQCWRVIHPGGASFKLEKVELSTPPGFDSLSVVSNRMLWTAKQGSQQTTVDNPLPQPSHWRKTWRGYNTQSPDGRWALVCKPFSPYLQIYQLPSFSPVCTITNPPRISGFMFSPTGLELVVVSRGRLEIFRTGTWERLRVSTNAFEVGSRGAMFSPDGRGLWFASDSRHAGLHSAQTFQPWLPLPLGHMPIDISADGRLLAAGTDDRKLVVWDFAQARSRLRDLGLGWTEGAEP